MLRYENPQDRSVIDATVDHLVHLGSGQWVGFSFGWMALLQIARSNGMVLCMSCTASQSIS